MDAGDRRSYTSTDALLPEGAPEPQADAPAGAGAGAGLRSFLFSSTTSATTTTTPVTPTAAIELRNLGAPAPPTTTPTTTTTTTPTPTPHSTTTPTPIPTSTTQQHQETTGDEEARRGCRFRLNCWLWRRLGFQTAWNRMARTCALVTRLVLRCAGDLARAVVRSASAWVLRRMRGWWWT